MVSFGPIVVALEFSHLRLIISHHGVKGGCRHVSTMIKWYLLRSGILRGIMRILHAGQTVPMPSIPGIILDKTEGTHISGSKNAVTDALPSHAALVPPSLQASSPLRLSLRNQCLETNLTTQEAIPPLG